MNDTLIQALFEVGFFQFGRFHTLHGIVPLQLTFDLLPSYPQVMKQIALTMSRRVTNAHDIRLLCQRDALPIGVAVSLETNIPLIHELGQFKSAVEDLAGAFDVGHPTIFIANQTLQTTVFETLSKKCAGVGLNIVQCLSLIGDDSNTDTLISLSSAIDYLETQKLIHTVEAKTVHNWLFKKTALNG